MGSLCIELRIMKLLVVFVLIGLAAAVPVAEPEAEPAADPAADPALVYTTGLSTYPYSTAYVSPYTAYSGYPTVYSTGYRYGLSHLAHPYTTPIVYGRKKRSAEPEAEPEADADPALVYTTAGLTYPYSGIYPYTTFGRYPTTYAYNTLPYTYTHATYPATSYTAVVAGRKKRSADPEPQPEADPSADPALVYTTGYSTIPAVTTRVAGTYSYPYVSTYGHYPYTTYPLTYGAYSGGLVYGK